MTSKDLAERKIESLNGLEEAMQMIQILDYDECIAVLNGVKRMPSVMHKAVIDRAKSLNGVTAELIIAGMQAVVNQ